VCNESSIALGAARGPRDRPRQRDPGFDGGRDRGSLEQQEGHPLKLDGKRRETGSLETSRAGLPEKQYPYLKLRTYSPELP